MKETTNKYLIAALLLGLVFHGTSLFFTLESTYDALIHLFFADHYANSWFEPWNYKWYTGFTVMSYPPLVHQSIALFSMIGGLKFGLFSVTLISIILFITGVYRFSLLITGHKTVAGYAALFAVFSSSFVETLHVFGQLPSIIGISVLVKNRQILVFNDIIITHSCYSNLPSRHANFWDGFFHLSFNRNGCHGSCK
jgi:uncharacterized membrane protein